MHDSLKQARLIGKANDDAKIKQGKGSIGLKEHDMGTTALHTGKLATGQLSAAKRRAQELGLTREGCRPYEVGSAFHLKAIIENCAKG